jgi:hypothetical protein
VTFEEIIAKARTLQDERNAIPEINSISGARSALGFYGQIINDDQVMIRELAERALELQIRIAALELLVADLLKTKLPQAGSLA